MGHTYASILVHAVFGTKDRRPMLRTDLRGRLYSYVAGIARKEFGQALKIGGTEDHLHGLLRIRPDVSTAQAMMKWKSLSSGWARRTLPGLATFAWQAGYGAFSVSESVARRVIRYIDTQEDHHRKQTFGEEFAALLQRHGMDLDSRDVWA